MKIDRNIEVYNFLLTDDVMHSEFISNSFIFICSCGFCASKGSLERLGLRLGLCPSTLDQRLMWWQGCSKGVSAGRRRHIF